MNLRLQWIVVAPLLLVGACASDHAAAPAGGPRTPARFALSVDNRSNAW